MSEPDAVAELEHTDDNDAPRRRCVWGQKGLPACHAGTRDPRYWCEPCRFIPPGKAPR